MLSGFGPSLYIEILAGSWQTKLSMLSRSDLVQNINKDPLKLNSCWIIIRPVLGLPLDLHEIFTISVENNRLLLKLVKSAGNFRMYVSQTAVMQNYAAQPLHMVQLQLQILKITIFFQYKS